MCRAKQTMNILCVNLEYRATVSTVTENTPRWVTRTIITIKDFILFWLHPTYTVLLPPILSGALNGD